MKVISFILIFLISALNVYALSFDDLEKNMVNDNIKGNFNQEKIITGFPKPIISKGSFIIKNKELLWITEQPRKSTIKINSNGIFSLSQDNKWNKIQGQYDKSMFLDIVNMNFKKISSFFDISLSGSADNWVMNLKPKTQITGKIFKNIIINGGKYVSLIEIIEENGDKTIMTFINIQ